MGMLTMQRVVAVLAAAFWICAAVGAPSPESVFRNPPADARTGVWWHWMGSNVTREGIVKDLDWFAEMGIGEAAIFAMADICTPPATEIYDCPAGKLVAFTPAWWKLVRFACDEAAKRGISLGLHNTPGYTSTGGPWIPPHLAMRELVFNVTNSEEQISLTAHANHPVRNPRTGKVEKPQMPCRREDLKEIAVVDGVRVQHIPMGAFNQPSQWELLGLECDKMNPEAVALHIDHVIGEMKRHLGDHAGRTIKFVLLDSYEAGRPTWTPRMREEFIARRGYDPLPFLPVLGGFKTKAAPTEADEKKFKSDYERTVKDLYRDVLFKTMRERLNAAGLEFVCEPYGGPFDSRECAAHVDRIMTEFWFDPDRTGKAPKPLGWNEWIGPDGRRHNIIAAEAFSASPKWGNWQETPSLLKRTADYQFARGVNRMILHGCVLQPWGDDVKPGKTLGRWGTHFGRNQTWAKCGKGFFDYLNRCQALLQWGEPEKNGKCKIESVKLSDGGKDAGKARKAISMLCRKADGRRVIFVADHSGRGAEVEVRLPDAPVSARLFNPVSGEISSLAVEDGCVSVSLAPHGSAFVVTAKGEGDLAASVVGCDGNLTTKNTKDTTNTMPSTVVPLRGKFTVRFGEVEIEMPELKDWTAFDDPRIRYFSGTAVYKCKIESVKWKMKNEKCGVGEVAILSLGNCNGQVAKVLLNGVDCGTVWCEPYEVTIPQGVLREEGNELEIEFTNVWANRLIGDEHEPPDCEFAPVPKQSGGPFMYLVRYPGWFGSGMASRPSNGRKCFVDWNYFTKDSPLVPSGLLGPVEIIQR